MRTSIATVTLGGGLRDKLAAIAAAGFDGVEIFETDVLAHDGAPAEIGRMVRDLGLEIVAFQPFRDFEGMPEPRRARGFERARRKFALMNELGTRRILVCSNTSPASLGGIDRAAEDLRALGEIAAAFDVEVGFEALAWGRHVSDYRDAWEIVRRADHPRVGTILDSWHILARGLPVDPIRAIPADRITFVQLADAPRLDMDLLQWSRHFRSFPGQGDLPLGAFMAALGATGYDGWLSLEVFNDRFRMLPPRIAAEDGGRSLLWLTGEGRLPPRAAVAGVEWIEFALPEEEAPALERLFAGMGFAPTGRHRSKDVTRWSQGGVNLVVNTDPDGFAFAHQMVHGPSVCAVGLRVGDAAAALDRAEALRMTAHRQPVGPGELEIPGVRALGGSLLYFTDAVSDLARVWEVEFEPTGAAASGAALTGIDHIACSMPHAELPTWRLFYLSLLDLETTPQVDVADPSGVVESMVVQDKARHLRIALNASQARQTMAARFISEYYGAGVQHIAFASADIFAAAAAMRAGGVATLPIPENYYDDLESRFDLAPELADRLRAEHVLYDEDEHGRYFQLYTQVFADRFFFEIVAREGYQGFGAPNAPIRLAAQTRLSRHPAVPKR